MRRITGDDGDNTFIGTGKDEWIRALGGDDLVKGRGGTDYLEGGTGVDTLNGGGGDDSLASFKVDGSDRYAGDLLDGGAGDDVINAGAGDSAFGGAGDDRFYAVGGAGGLFLGGAGLDQLVFQYSSDDPYVGEALSLVGRSERELEGAVVGGFESGRIVFGDGDDVVTAPRGAKDLTLDGGRGDDHLIGRGGNNTLEGGFGSDTLDGGAGDDVLHDAWYRISGQAENVQLMHGGAGNDRLTAVYDLATLVGGSGDDVLSGSGELDGGSGADTLMAGSGADLLKGGEGADTYVFERYNLPVGTADRIEDSTIASIDLSPLDAVQDGKSGNQAFRIVDAFDGQAGELVIRYDPNDGLTHVEGDVYGHGEAGLVILIKGDHTDPGLFVL